MTAIPSAPDVPTDDPQPGASVEGPPPAVSDRWRRAALVAAVLRYALPLAAIPFIPALLPERLLTLLLVRPGKEFLLLGGGQLRTTGQPSLLAMFLAYLPLMVGGVWAFFLVGRAYARVLRDGEGPAWLDRLVPPDTLRVAQRVLEKRGPVIAILGRVAALPPTVVAAAAGTSSISARRFLTADLIGAVLSFGVTVGVGVALGSAYSRGGPWLAGAGVVLFLALLVLAGRWFRREAARQPAEG